MSERLSLRPIKTDSRKQERERTGQCTGRSGESHAQKHHPLPLVLSLAFFIFPLRCLLASTSSFSIIPHSNNHNFQTVLTDAALFAIIVLSFYVFCWIIRKSSFECTKSADFWLYLSWHSQFSSPAPSFSTDLNWVGIYEKHICSQAAYNPVLLQQNCIATNARGGRTNLQQQTKEKVCYFWRWLSASWKLLCCLWSWEAIFFFICSLQPFGLK